MRLVVPISVSHIQFKATSRIVLSMVDTVPCIGGATLSLLGVPHVDFRLVLFGGPDLMALPGVKAATHMIIQVSCWDLPRQMLPFIAQCLPCLFHKNGICA